MFIFFPSPKFIYDLYCDKSTFWPLPAPILKALRTRCLLSRWAAMAASCVFPKFQMRSTLLKNPQKVERFLSRTARTVASAQSEAFQAGERLCCLSESDGFLCNYPARSCLFMN